MDKKTTICAIIGSVAILYAIEAIRDYKRQKEAQAERDDMLRFMNQAMAKNCECIKELI